MKKTVLVLGFSLISSQVFAARLACWNLFSKTGSRPVLTANIVRNDELARIVIVQDADTGFNTKGLRDSAQGTAIVSTRSPYIGNNEFILAEGVRLILPTDLDPEALAKTVIKAGQVTGGTAARQNGVLDVEGGRWPNDQGGHGYVRMHCVSQ